MLSDDHKTIHRRWSARISAGGALGGIGGALALASGAAPWAGILPLWLVFLLGGIICACSLIATYIKQKNLHDDER